MERAKKVPKFNVKKAKRELDILWSKAIRARDPICRKCGKANSNQAAHIFTRGNLSTRWDIQNGWGSCYYCHIIWSHRNPLEFAEWIQHELGLGVFAALKRKSKKIYDSSNFPKDYERIKVELSREADSLLKN